MDWNLPVMLILKKSFIWSFLIKNLRRNAANLDVPLPYRIVERMSWLVCTQVLLKWKYAYPVWALKFWPHTQNSPVASFFKFTLNWHYRDTHFHLFHTAPVILLSWHVVLKPLHLISSLFKPCSTIKMEGNFRQMIHILVLKCWCLPVVHSMMLSTWNCFNTSKISWSIL